MAIVIKRTISENGKKIVEFTLDNHPSSTVFTDIVRMSQDIIADEFRLNIDDLELTFKRHVTAADLKNMYEYKSSIDLGTPEHHHPLSDTEYRDLEFSIHPFDKSHWLPKERLQALHAQLDLALLFHQIPWAKELHHSIQLIEQTLDKNI